MLALMLCLPCVMAEEIGELPPPVVEQPDDPNEIGELGGNKVPNKATVGNEVVEENTPPDNELIEDSGYAPVAPPVASGDTVTLRNISLAVPADWSIVSNVDDSANGGAIVVMLSANDGTNQMLMAQSQSIGTKESIQGILAVMSAESFLSQTLIGTMQSFGIVVENYDYVTLQGDIPCVRATETITLAEGNGFIATTGDAGECAMSLVVALDDTNMVVVMLIQEDFETDVGVEMMNMILSPMAQ